MYDLADSKVAGGCGWRRIIRELFFAGAANFRRTHRSMSQQRKALVRGLGAYG